MQHERQKWLQRWLRSPREAAPERRAIAALILGALLLGGCTTFSNDGGMSTVASIAGDSLHGEVAALRTPEEAAAARARTKALIRRPLTAGAAVQVALLNNRGLQAAYNELGMAEAAMVEQSLPPSPTFSLQRIAGSVEIEIERKIIADILALATLPARSEIAAERFHAAQLRAAQETLRVAAETRRAYYRAIAANQRVALLGEAASAADSAAKLAARLGESGSMNKLDQARQQAFSAETAAQLAQARQQAEAERERLIRAMGLWGDDLAFKIPNALPPLPARPRNLPTVEMQAVARRLDLRIARIELDALARSYGLTEATRFVNLLEAGAAGKTTIDKPTGQRIRDLGFEAQLQVPLFDFGGARLREAEERYMGSFNRLMEMAVNARSQARAAYRAYRSAYDIATHYRNEVMPLRQIISDETTLRYNAMMIDVFALLTEARQRTAAAINSIAAQQSFWLATVDLDGAILAGGPSAAGDAPSLTSAAPDGADAH
jgi:outer membrane protein TolC